jgi:DNA-binding FrmR family transcriptional regulator
MKKTILLASSLALLGMLPAMAQFTKPSLGKVWVDFQEYARDLQSYLGNETYPGNNYDNLPSPSRVVESEMKDAIDYSASYYIQEGKIPNPIAAGNRFRERVFDNSSGTFENNPEVQVTIATNEITRQMTRGVVESVLGERGQERSKAKLENVENSVESIEKAVESAEESKSILDQIVSSACQAVTNTTSTTTGGTTTGAANQACANVTQANMQLQNLIIQREQSKMLGETLGLTIQGNQFQQYSNLNLANISQQMEEANRARRVDASAEAAQLLKATSQADLLGVRINSDQ